MKDLDLLQELRASLIKANSEGSWQDYWVSKIENDRQIVMAWIAYKQGKRDEALRMLRAAADHEDFDGMGSRYARTYHLCPAEPRRNAAGR